MKYILKSHRLLVAITTLLVLTLSFGILIVPIEKPHPNTSYRGIGDGLWWAFTTTTGVGYGDLVPKTTLGRIVGVVLEIVGVTNFGLIIAFITVALMRKEQQFFWSRLTKRFDQLEERLASFERKQQYTIKEGQK